MTMVVEAIQLSKWFKTVRGISDISFQFEGGILGLLGPNGAGKSTLLKLLSGQAKPTQGEIYIFGERIWNNPSMMKRIGFSPEQDDFYDWQTGHDFLQFLARLSDIPNENIENQVRKALELTQLTENGNRLIRQYSKGMRQRLKVAQALLHDPDLIILDEPLNGTDPVGRYQLIDLLKNLAKQGKHIIISSHILHEVDAMTQNILLLLNGHVKASGNTSELRKLFGEKPTKIHLVCAQERELATILVKFPFIQSLQIQPKELTIETLDLQAFYQQLTEIVLTTSLQIQEIRVPDEDLESIFKYLAG
ncbi:MAG: ABC transporter ATP-binding protein [Planctomycetota bacterium]